MLFVYGYVLMFTVSFLKNNVLRRLIGGFTALHEVLFLFAFSCA